MSCGNLTDPRHRLTVVTLHTARMQRVTLPGGRMAADGIRDAARLTLGAGWLLGAWPQRLSRACRAEDPSKVHALERRWAHSATQFLNLQLDMAGQEHVEPIRRTVLVALHEGFADALALLHLGLDLRFVARDELSEWPTLGRYLRESGHVLVDTTLPRSSFRRMLTGGAEALDRGETVVVFPQGSILGIEVAFMRGAFRLAERLDAWVLPVVITGSHQVWEYPYSPLVRFGQRMSMRVLPAVPPDEAVLAAPDLEKTMKTLALAEGMAPARRFQPEIDGYWDGYHYEIDPAFPELAAQVADHRRKVT